jgi:hypothetical protein
MLAFRVVTPCGLVDRFSPEDGDSMFLRNVGVYLQVHTALQTIRPTSTRDRNVSFVTLCGEYV